MPKFIIRPGADIIGRLKSAGYSTYRLQRENIIGQSTLTKYRRGGLPSWNELAKLVSLLHVSPVDLIAYQTDDGRVFDLTGRRLDIPSPPPFTVQHGHPGDDGYDPDDPGDQIPCDPEDY